MPFVKKIKNYLPLIAIIIVAFILRTIDLNWDQNFHLHPDERFLTMVGNAMKLPNSFAQYLDPHTSLLNPANIGYTFYVYGLFPVILNKIIALFLMTDTYNMFTLQGRLLAAFADTATLIFLFLTVLLFEKQYRLSPNVKFMAAFFYAISVLPIQLSHFFTVDPFLNFFVFGSFYFLLRFYFESGTVNLCFGAVFFGLGLATKVSAIYIFPLLFVLLTEVSGHIKVSSLYSHKKVHYATLPYTLLKMI